MSENCDVQLRPVIASDLPIFFAHRRDPEAIQMAAFTSGDPGDFASFAARWERFLSDPTIVNRTILANGQVAGSIASYMQEGERELTYWIGKEYWGKGVTTAAVRLFLAEIPVRPLFARAAKDNLASLRVLEKSGFCVIGEDCGEAMGRGGIEVEEWVLQLDAKVE